MSATHCLGPFAAQLRKLPRDQWKGLVESVPVKCEKGCGVECRNFCASYARVQWRMAALREKGANA